MVFKNTTGFSPRIVSETNIRADLSFSAALKAATWCGGQPLAIDANGLKEITVAGTGASDFYGIAAYGYDGATDTQLGGFMKVESTSVSTGDKLTVYRGQFTAYLAGEYVNGTWTTSFSATPTGGAWSVGDKVYISNAGKWDDTAVGTASMTYGVVTEVVGAAAAATGLVVDFHTPAE
jgi:hypothetical protein